VSIAAFRALGPLVGVGSGVGCLASELDIDPRDGEEAARHICRPCRRVDHHSHIHPLEDPAVRHPQLRPGARAMPLLRWGAQDPDLSGQVLEELAQGDAGAHPSRADDVVPASMADAWEGIVLAEVSDAGAPGLALEDGLEGGLHPLDPPLNLEAVLLQLLHEELAGLVLLAPQLGVAPDPVAHLH